VWRDAAGVVDDRADAPDPRVDEGLARPSKSTPRGHRRASSWRSCGGPTQASRPRTSPPGPRPHRRPASATALHRRVAASERGQAAVVGALRNAGQGGEPRDRQLGCRSQGLEVGEGTRSTYSEPFCQIRSCTVISWASTASTGRSRVSTGTGSLLLLKIELPVTDQPRNPARKSDAHQRQRPERPFCCASACQKLTAGSRVPPHGHRRTKPSCESTTVEGASSPESSPVTGVGWSTSTTRYSSARRRGSG
jgi:hypothetical protein